MSLLWPILKHAFRTPRRTAVVDDRFTFSYAKLLGAALQLADRIELSTQRPHVGLMLPTGGLFPAALLGTWYLGRTAVPLNYLLAKDELRHVIEDSGIDTIVTVGPMLDFVGRDAIPDHINLVELSADDFQGLPTPRWPAPTPDDKLAVLLYTSGTSGKPKGVMLSHGNLAFDVQAACRHAGLREADTFLGVLPQFHSFGLTALTLIPLYLNACVVYTARFVPTRIVDLIRKHQPQVLMAVPSMYGALLSVKSAKPEDFASIRIAVSGGEPLPEALEQACRNKLGLDILEGYGLTETAPVTHWSTPERRKPRSVGPALPGVRTIVLDEHGQPLGPNAEGEIHIAGPNVMLGYYKRPDLTAEAITTLHLPGEPPLRAFRTGDIGHVDEDGFLYITGRKKEMLIIGGENVFPREIEEILNQHPMVKDSAVIGRHDPVRGEVPIAFVEAEDGGEFDAGAVRTFCRDRLAAYKVPREVHVMEDLPRGPTGKVLRRALRDQR